MTEEEQLSYVSRCGGFIRFIENPSEAVQLAAVNKDGSAIQDIENPHESVQMMAIQKGAWVICSIDCPSPKAIKTALTTQSFINNSYDYDRTVKKIFADNALLMKKWLRYSESMREG